MFQLDSISSAYRPLVDAKRFQAEDSVMMLKEDPAFFSDMMQEEAKNTPGPFRQKVARLQFPKRIQP